MSDTNTEEMASFEVLYNQPGSGSFESNEYSFLQEAHASSNLPNGSLNHVNEDFDLTNMQSTLNSAQDQVVEEVHSHLMELLKENQSLKESLNKNNSMMKDQMSTISAWREQMIQSKNQQQEDLQKAKERITELEKEYSELQEKSGNFENACESKETTEESDTCIKGKSVEEASGSKNVEEASGSKNVEESSKCENEEDTSECKTMEAASECKNVEEASNTLSEENITDDKTTEMFPAEIPDCLFAIQYLAELINGSKLPASKKENCNDIFEFLKAKINTFEQSSTVVQTDEECGYEVVHQKNLKNSDIQEQVENLKKTIEDQNHELEDLRKTEQQFNDQVKALDIRAQEYELELKSKYEEMMYKQESEESLIEKYKLRCESLQQKVDEYYTNVERAKVSDTHTVQELHEDVRNLQEILKLEQDSNQKDKEKLREMLVKCENLQVDHDRVTKLLEIQTKDMNGKDDEIMSLKENITQLYIQIDHLTAKMYDLDQTLEEKNEELGTLETERSTYKDQLESIPILKSQLEVCKKELEDEIKAKNAMCEKNESLTNELKRCRGYDSMTSSPSSSHRKHGHGRKNLTEESHFFHCPVCPMKFTTEQAIQNHVEKCLDKSN